MSLKENFELMSRYNQWYNQTLYQTIANLSSEELSQDCGLFFNSLLGTLNHLLVVDILWFKRFSNHPSLYNFDNLDYVRSLPQPLRLDIILYPEFLQLKSVREKMDLLIIDCFLYLAEEDYDVILSYKNTKRQSFKKRFGFLVHNLFNHQIHHRGQITAILSQKGIDYGVTDSLAIIPDE